jgi:ADP-ribose pyrophosphatase
MPDSAKISSKRVYSGKILTVDVDTVRFPDGSSGELEMVRHKGASAVVPFLSDPEGDDPQLLLIKQYRYAAEEFIYEIPAGKLDVEGEDPKGCAERELLEETGCSAVRIEHMTTIYTTPGFTDERIHLFFATGLSHGETRHEKDEFMTMEPMPLSRALELIRDGTIKDAKTMIGILFAAGFVAKR